MTQTEIMRLVKLAIAAGLLAVLVDHFIGPATYKAMGVK